MEIRNPDEMPDFDLSQDELKLLVALAGVMAIGIHYGVDPSTSNELPEDLEKSGGLLGVMMNAVRAADRAGDLLHDIIERAETAEQDKIRKAFEQIVNPSE